MVKELLLILEEKMQVGAVTGVDAGVEQLKQHQVGD